MGDEAFRSGRLEEALDLLDRALELARDLRDQREIDRTVCCRCAVLIERGQPDEAASALGKILLRTAEPENRRLASYHLARAYDLRKDWQKALFYVEKSQEYAEQLGRTDWLASGFNRLGTIHVASSRFDEAIQAFEQALSYMTDEPNLERAIIIDNLGYCHIVQGRFLPGFGALFESLRSIRRHKARFHEIEPRLDLAFAFLEVEKPRSALRHAMRALALAEEMDNHGSTKIALFLLGEAAKNLGDDLGARDYFARLQETFYPEDPYLIDLLLVIDARDMVNLKA